MKHIITILIITISSIITIIGKPETDMNKLILDFVDLMKPKGVVTVLCWKKGELYQLSKHLATQYFSHGTIAYHNVDIYGFVQANNWLMVTETGCNTSLNLLYGIDSNLLAKSNHIWLNFNIKDSTGLQNKIPLNFNSRFYSVDKISNQVYQISEKYKYHPKDHFFESERKYLWSLAQGFSNVNRMQNKTFRRDLKGAQLSISMIAMDKENWKDVWNFRESDTDGFYKFHYILMETLVEYLNATGHYSYCSSWGYNLSRLGNQPSMYGDLAKDLVDVGGVTGFMTDDNVDAVDFLPLTVKTDYKFIYRSPRFSHTKNIFILPFDRYVWISVLLTLIATVFILHIIFTFEQSMMKIDLNQEGEEQQIVDAALYCAQGAVSQSVERVPQTFSGRIALITYLSSVVYLNTSYSGQIFAFLQSTSNDVMTIEDLLNTDIMLGIENVSHSYIFFQNLEDPLKRAIYEAKISGNYMDVTTGMVKVRDEFFAFHGFAIDTFRIIEKIFPDHKKCDLKLLDFLNLKTESAFSVKKNLPYKEIIKIGLMRIYESGLKLRNYYMVFCSQPTCNLRTTEFLSVALDQCYFPFQCLIGGMVISCLLLLIERTAFHYTNPRQ